VPPVVPTKAPEFVQKVTAMMMAGKGDAAGQRVPADGTWPTGTTKWEKRNIALEIPIWDPRSASSATSARWSARTRRSARRLRPERARRAGPSRPTTRQGPPGARFTIQVAPDDCTGCGLCVESARRRTRRTRQAQGDQHGAQAADPRAGAENYDFFLDLPEIDRTRVTVHGRR
jgi:pyruvate-ferredoxin/flavodoxin oxidoreductase